MEGRPTRFGHYWLIDELGTGGMGVVYRAQDEQTLEQVALKTIRDATDRLLWCIRHEIHALSQIRHPGVIRIYDHGFEHGYPWYAMELFEGLTLDKYLDTIWADRRPHLSSEDGIFDFLEPTQRLTPHEPSRDVAAEPGSESPAGVEGPVEIAQASTPPIPEERPAAAGGQLTSILTLVRHICVTLAHIHGNGLVHLDLKPTNVFIRRDWTPVVFDFSLVAGVIMVGREDLQPGQSVQGTLGYMAPEQFRGEAVDARTDLYSLGCLLYECITGQLPFVAETFREMSHAHQHVSPVPPSLLVSGVPPDLERTVMRLLAKRPRERVGNALDVARTLQTLGALNVQWGTDPPPKDYLYRPEFVGRRSAMQWLEKHLNALLVGQGGCVFVGAESGVGKTRLMMEFARVCESRNVRVITGHCEVTGKRPCHHGTLRGDRNARRRLLDGAPNFITAAFPTASGAGFRSLQEGGRG
jgi:serine/threonine protein kinase